MPIGTVSFGSGGLISIQCNWFLLAYFFSYETFQVFSNLDKIILQVSKIFRTGLAVTILPSHKELSFDGVNIG